MATDGARGTTGRIGLPSGTLYSWVSAVEGARSHPASWEPFTCAGCGLVFYKRAGVARTVRTCSFECSRAYNDRIRGPLPRPSEKRCETCANVFPVARSGIVRRYCDTCLSRRKRERSRRKSHPRGNAVCRPTTIKCEDCETNVPVKPVGNIPTYCATCINTRRLSTIRATRAERARTYRPGHIYKSHGED